jgi:hypothetical protein
MNDGESRPVEYGRPSTLRTVLYRIAIAEEPKGTVIRTTSRNEPRGLPFIASSSRRCSCSLLYRASPSLGLVAVRHVRPCYYDRPIQLG